MRTTIRKVLARPIFDGCARPSFEVLVETAGTIVVAAPSYSDPRSSGKYEINHFPSGGVAGSIDLINTGINNLLNGSDAADQRGIDDALISFDGTNRFEIIGGNTAEAVSMAVAKAAAASLDVPLYRHASGGGRALAVPHLMLNIIGGGATMGDEGWRGRTPDMQDHLIVAAGCESQFQTMDAIAKVFHEAGRLLRDADDTFTGGRDEEYCWLPSLDDIDLYREQTRAFGARALIIGDDLLATNETRLIRMADDGAVNAAVVKLNMAGTVSRTGRFTDLCRERGMATIGAARTYDSPDDTLADLVVGWGHTGYKCGAPAGGEHAAKYNRFIRIEEELRENGGALAEYPGIRP